jgi:hypothetical protein
MSKVVSSTLRGAPGLKLAAEQADSLREPGQPGAATTDYARSGGGIIRAIDQFARPVVGHLDHDPVVAVGQADRSRGARCIPDCIGQAFLHDPVTSKLDSSAPRALFAPPQVMSRQKPMITSPVPHTSGLMSLRSSATSSHSTCVLLLGDLQEPVLQPGPLDGHRLGDDPARHQHTVHVPAAVVLNDKLSVRMRGRPPGQQPSRRLGVRGTDLDPDPPPDRSERRGRALLDESATAPSSTGRRLVRPSQLITSMRQTVRA